MYGNKYRNTHEFSIRSLNQSGCEVAEFDAIKTIAIASKTFGLC
jgi:hypothetical protein